MREAEEVERIGLIFTAPGPVGGSLTAKLDHARPFRVQVERKLRQTHLQIGEDMLGSVSALEPNDGIV